ncbi:MAG: hypothetical protein IPJ01_12775 [Micavibrio sp.]|nr:hypothetical protein [Micavibrio sp.]
MQQLNLHINPKVAALIRVNNKDMWRMGDTVPTDGEAGYHKGCIWIKTDGGAGTTLYINEGSETACDFNAK